MFSSVIVCLGTILQTINFHSLTGFYFFRLIAGLGIGAISVVVPIFSSEMTPKELRGQIGSFYQLFITFGIFTAYWTDYAAVTLISSKESRQWQIPIGLQLIPALLLGLGMLTLRESTRWLTMQDRHAEAWESLQWIRAAGDETTQAEMAEIRAGVEFEKQAKVGFRARELYQNKDNRRRVFTAITLFIAQQATGATAFAYFAPQYFKLVVNNVYKDLLLTAIFGAVKIIACGTFVLFIAERLRRKHILVVGALLMGACQISAAAVLKTHPKSGKSGNLDPAGLAVVILIYLFVTAYNFSWGPLPWPLVAEIFPTRTREIGVGIGVASQWLFNFVFTIGTPYMISSMGWGNFVLWGAFDVLIAVGVWLTLEETRGRSLEDIAKTVKPGAAKREGYELETSSGESSSVGGRTAAEKTSNV